MLSSLGNLSSALSISILNQVVSSATTFAFFVYLVRTMEKPQFGLYSLGFAFVLIISGLIISLISVQFVVNLPDQFEHKRKDYAVGHAAAVGVLGLAIIGVGVFVKWTSPSLQFGALQIKELVLPVTVTSAFFAMRDFFSRVAYSEHLEKAVLVASITAAFVMFVIFFGFWIAGIVPSVQVALYSYAAGHVSGCFAILIFIRLPWSRFSILGLQKAFQDSWSGGRWDILTSIIYSMRTQAHSFVVGPFLGATALAEVNASRVLITPAVMIIPPLTQVLIPRLAQQRKQGISGLARVAALSIGGLTVLAVAYCCLLLILLPWILPLAFGKAYGNIEMLVFSWCAVAILLALRNGFSLLLQVVREFKKILLVNIAAAIVSINLIIALSEALGSVGAVIALAMGEAMLCIMLALMLRKHINGCQKLNLDTK